MFKKAIPDQGKKILDIGCGTGVLGEYFRKNQNCEVHGVEINNVAYEIAREKLNSVIKANIESVELPYAPNTFDFIVMGDVLEHLINPVQTLEKLYRVLKPGGKIFIAVPNIRLWKISLGLILKDNWQYQSSGILDFTHLRFFTLTSIQQMLRDAGFTNVEGKRVIQNPSKSHLINRFTFGVFAGLLASHSFVTIKKG
jgi:methionine biosynthesis protein MetW